MEKQLKLKNKILKLLPKAAASVTFTFQNPPFSPVRDHKSRPDNTRLRPYGVKGSSASIVPMIPDEARRRPKDGGNGAIDYQEPTSPKISCMGQIKHKKNQIKNSKTKNAASNASSSTSKDTGVKKHVSTFQIKRMLSHGTKPKSEGRKSNASAPDPEDNKDALGDRVLHVSQLKRFASGRDTYANFDWKKAQVAPDEIENCYSDEDTVESVGEDEDEVIIPFSAPMLIGGGGIADGCLLNLKPRNEINLWKRRTMAQPRPLQLNPVIRAK